MNESPFQKPPAPRPPQAPHVTADQVRQVRLAKKAARDQLILRGVLWGGGGLVAVIIAAGLGGLRAVFLVGLVALIILIVHFVYRDLGTSIAWDFTSHQKAEQGSVPNSLQQGGRSPMKAIMVLVALAMGFFSGFLVYMAAAMLFTEGQPSPAFVFIIFLGGWAVSVVILLRGARSVSRVFTRGFLLGAAEWLAMIPVGMILSGRHLSQTATRGASDAEMAGATIGAGIVSFVTGGVAIAMAIVCLVGFAVAHLMGREMKPEPAGPTKRCPDCAELIQEAAKKCKHCGAVLASG